MSENKQAEPNFTIEAANRAGHVLSDMTVDPPSKLGEIVVTDPNHPYRFLEKQRAERLWQQEDVKELLASMYDAFRADPNGEPWISSEAYDSLNQNQQAMVADYIKYLMLTPTEPLAMSDMQAAGVTVKEEKSPQFLDKKLAAIVDEIDAAILRGKGGLGNRTFEDAIWVRQDLTGEEKFKLIQHVEQKRRMLGDRMPAFAPLTPPTPKEPEEKGREFYG